MNVYNDIEDTAGFIVFSRSFLPPTGGSPFSACFFFIYVWVCWDDFALKSKYALYGV